jgi:hypothetical protein
MAVKSFHFDIFGGSGYAPTGIETRAARKQAQGVAQVTADIASDYARQAIEATKAAGGDYVAFRGKALAPLRQDKHNRDPRHSDQTLGLNVLNETLGNGGKD